MPLTTTNEIPPAVQEFYNRVILKTAYPKLVHLKFAQEAKMPSKRGNTYKWRRYAKLTPATTPLTEGTPPSGKQLSVTDITVELKQYGDYVEITDWVDLTVEDPVLTEAAEILGKQAGESFDTLTRDILIACASVSDAAGGSNGNTPTEITTSDIDAVVKILLGNNAEMISSIIKATGGIGTIPVRPAFFAIMHTDLIDDLESCVGFTPVSQYPQQDGIDDAEWGAVKNTRWLVSTNADPGTGTPKIYKLPVIGKDAYGTVDLQKIQNIIKGFGSAGTADPLNQKATSGWKAAWAGKILNDSFMHVLRVTHS